MHEYFRKICMNIDRTSNICMHEYIYTHTYICIYSNIHPESSLDTAFHGGHLPSTTYERCEPGVPFSAQAPTRRPTAPRRGEGRKVYQYMYVHTCIYTYSNMYIHIYNIYNPALGALRGTWLPHPEGPPI